MKVIGIIVAAGKGSRMGADKNKVFLELCGKTILENTVGVFEECNKIDEIVVVTNDVDFCNSLLSGHKKVSAVIPGGASRQESVKNGLLASGGDIAVIHDGARALVRCEEIESAILAAEKFGAAAVGVKCKDTLKAADENGFIKGTVDRETTYNIQTPQVFLYSEIKRMHMNAPRTDFTDDCALAESFGARIKIVEGSYDNLKITTPDDLPVAEKILESRRATK